MNAWSLQGATVDFAGHVALRDIELTSAPGEVIALVGASGAGKSTLLRVLAASQGLIRGRATVLGTGTQDLWGSSLRSLRRDVGWMLQQNNIVDGLRVFHNVAMGCLGRWSTLRGLATLAWPQREDIAMVESALGQVELEGRTWDWPRELSGGERQRVALARLLVQDPKLWLADEPAAGLDPRLRVSLTRTTIALVRARKAAAVISLHDTELLREGFDRVIGLRDGVVVLDASPDELDQKRVADLYTSA